ncbi:Protein translocase subunit YajC [hydrothermal vent metagenome]|uniref:Protein translocase subunit YajC n=1 Tax=hydrothermal vent metagenome TaxID=652676 RepID=A0A3B0SSR8_9ZZZZ
MFISQAIAQTAGATGGESAFMQFLPFILIIAVFYFLMIRPQQKRAKEHRNMVAALRRGDNVVTSGGIVAKVSKVLDDNEVELEIASGVKIKVIRSTISTVIGKPAPANDTTVKK